MINKNSDYSFSKSEFLLQNIDRYESYPANLVHAFQIFNQKYRHFEPISITPKSKLVVDKKLLSRGFGSVNTVLVLKNLQRQFEEIQFLVRRYMEKWSFLKVLLLLTTLFRKQKFFEFQITPEFNMQVISSQCRKRINNTPAEFQVSIFN